MKLLHYLSTLLFIVAIATAAHTREEMLQDVDNVNSFYKLCAGRNALRSGASLDHCLKTADFQLFRAYEVLGSDPIELGTCAAVSSALKPPFDSGKLLWDLLQTQEVVCLAKTQIVADQIKRELDVTLESWEQKYLPRYHNNCKEDKGSVFYVYQECKEPSKSLRDAIAALEAWILVCAFQPEEATTAGRDLARDL
ncbi:hypothetical protein BJX66DRAFT_344899 [Aspergillus keveii]|uniref:Uncharacterized protein n=1 Tax=Aspergillus keveii TaxID=714993 RepID=A0ABR4FJM3_9EURO